MWRNLYVDFRLARETKIILGYGADTKISKIMQETRDMPESIL